MSSAPEETSPASELRRLIRLHALSSRQAGVDFLPISDRFFDASLPMQIEEESNVAAVPVISVPQRSALTAATSGPNRAAETNSHANSAGAPPAVQARFAPPTPSSPAAAANVRAPAAQSFMPTEAGSAALFGEKSMNASTPAELAPLPKLSLEEATAWLERLRARYEHDAPHKAFVTDHHNIVFGEGNPIARLMFVGEAPGAEEDRAGRPFVGRSGQLLDKMITAMGMDRKQVYIANVLKTRPPDNATPTFEEAAACAPYLFEQIAIIRPEAIVTLGLPATRLLLNTRESMSNLRGRWSTFVIPPKLPHPETRPQVAMPAVPVMPTFHPAFLLRAYTKENRQKVWSDLLHALDRLGLPRPAANAATQ